jgi:hypothetical protein
MNLRQSATLLFGRSPRLRSTAAVDAQGGLASVLIVIDMLMVLQLHRIADEQITRIPFAATMGALALGLAIAFGLRGRPVAHRMAQGHARKQHREAYDKYRGTAARHAVTRDVCRGAQPCADYIPDGTLEDWDPVSTHLEPRKGEPCC